ncbi:type VII secretion target [Nocardia panacis]|nr:type VII secretion target [Nocardia panacis]
MAGNFDVDYQEFLRLAAEHRRAAEETREWSKPPRDWLARFQATYGHIADDVYEALGRYYHAREEAGLELAKSHDDTAEQLQAAVETFRQTEGNNVAEFNNTLPGHGSPGPHDPMPGSHPVPASHTPPPAHDATPAAPGHPPAAGGHAAGPTGDPNPQHESSGMSAAPNPTAGQQGSGMPAQSMPGVSHPSMPGSETGGPSAGTPGQHGVAAPTNSSAAVNDSIPPLSAFAPEGGVTSGTGRGSETQSPSAANEATEAVPAVVPTPFSSAVAAAKQKAAEPDYVVGDSVNEDLVLAKTLLGAVLAAVDTPVGMMWAVSVVRGPDGIGVFLTSNEGRGWLPAGLFLPRTVSTPWLWDEFLGVTEGSPWEGVADPARVLAEFGLAWGEKAGGATSALVSSGSIDPGLRAQLPEVAMEGMVAPNYDVDLRVATADTTDRLGLTGSIDGLKSLAQVPDSQVHARTVQMASDAHRHVSYHGARSAEAAEARRARDRILAMVHARQPVSRALWAELREADDLLAASMLTHRVDVGRVGLGELRIVDEAADLRDLVFERRCNELVLLLAEEPQPQVLRDAAYAHEQIVNHPTFVAAPAPVSAAPADRVARTAPPVGGVTAPSVSAPPTEAPPSIG